MEYKTIDGAKIPVLGIGTWEIGGRFETDKSKEQQWITAIRQAVELGFTHIDTAEVYGAGFTEQMVGKAIKQFKREDLFITSKVWSNHLKYEDVIKSAAASVKRLNSRYLDLYLIHWPSSEVPLKETMKALEKLQKDGVVKFIGVSNFSMQQIIEAQNCLSTAKIAAVQNQYNLLHRDDEVLQLCQKEKMLFVAYRPLAKGLLAKPGILLLDKLAEKYSKTQAQIAINWLISKPQVVTIPKATTIEHLKDNLGAIGWRIDKEDYEALDNEEQ